jgi:hypothetical protein
MYVSGKVWVICKQKNCNNEQAFKRARDAKAAGWLVSFFGDADLCPKHFTALHLQKVEV